MIFEKARFLVVTLCIKSVTAFILVLQVLVVL